MDDLHRRRDALDVLLGGDVTGGCCAGTGRWVMLSFDTAPYR